MNDEDTHRKPPRHEIGQDLAALSLDELAERIDLLKSEIRRLEEEVEAKRGSADAAESLFRKKG